MSSCICRQLNIFLFISKRVEEDKWNQSVKYYILFYDILHALNLLKTINYYLNLRFKKWVTSISRFSRLQQTAKVVLPMQNIGTGWNQNFNNDGHHGSMT